MSLAGFLPSLAAALDKPGFNWKYLVLGFSATKFAFESYLSYRQYQVLKRTTPPKTLEGAIDQETFTKTQTYGRAKAEFGFVSSVYSSIIDTAVILADVLPKFWNVAGSLVSLYAPARFSGVVTQSVTFFLGYNILSTLISLPVSIYSTFVLEEKFGFNKQTPSLFASDLIKGQILTAVIGGPLIAAFLKIVDYFGANFFYYLWVFAFVFQLFMVTVYPIVIEPLFNKVTPMKESQVKTEVENLAAKLKFPLREVYQIDGSKRSAHSNAYFYGLPWAKRIVIYDTLLEKFEPIEIVAVLAHELGHWSLSHTTQFLLINQAYIFSLFVAFSVFIKNQSLYQSFGFGSQMPVMIGFILFGDILTPLNSLLQYSMSVLSRKFEYQADAFAVKLNYAEDLCNALIKLHIQNLSTMDADWLYSSYHYSHPILPERLSALGWKSAKKEE
ncbi:peptidase family M48-domain-containing protein [Kockiozyma suomiensis]|uniref:peptidase family M48-domain-containing protein n=1 Tax=Kockiozyma suomiensis TaxID=1337062 RepID=UPI0033430CA9